MESGVRPRINRHAIYEWHSDTYTSFNIPSFGIRFSYAIDAFSIPAASSAFVSSPPEETEKEETTSSVSSDTVSSMGFDFSSYYQDKSSMPIHIEKPKTRWMSGPDPLCKYMNDVYIPLTMNHSSDKDKMIIYAKRGTTGIAGQISGMCDVLLLGILNDRVFKCLCCPWQ